MAAIFHHEGVSLSALASPITLLVCGNRLLRLLFKGVYMFRPGIIQPLHGIQSKTALYRILYLVIGPFIPLLTALLPKIVTTTEQVGRAMIRIAKQGAPKRLLENMDINAL